MLAGLAAVLLVAVSVTACGTGSAVSATTTRPPDGTAATLSLPERLEGQTASRADLDALIEGGNRFSVDLFKAVRKSRENLVCSPYSASTVLTMTMAGARGQTRDEMEQVLRITLPYYSLNGAVNALDRDLAAGGQFQSVNGLWAQTGRTIKQPFVNVAGRYYDAAVNVYDMEGDYPGLCDAVNGWVSDNTGGLIKDLMDPRDRPAVPYLLMMLVNAVHFKADWMDQFSDVGTQPEPFHLLDGAEADVRMMRNESTSYRYLETDGLQAVELPYDSPRFAMTVLMPAEGSFEDFAAGLDDSAVAEVIDGLKSGKVRLKMPSFEITSTPDVTGGLRQLGMVTAFDLHSADFTGIADPIDGMPWFITHVEQKAYIKVNERGTEAAAATGVTMAAGGTTTTAEPPVEITIDRPFVYLIRNTQNGAIVFIGQVVDPRGASGS